MIDFHEVIRSLQNELDQTKQELKRKEKQIQSLKKTNKIQEAHVELQRKKIADLETKKSSVLVDQDSQKVQELSAIIDKLNIEIDTLRSNNRKMKEESYLSKQEGQELMNKLKNSESQLKNLIQKSKLQKSKYENGSKQFQKKISSLEGDITKLKKKNADLEQAAKSYKKASQNNIQKVQPKKQVAPIFEQEAVSKIRFYEAVPMTQSMSENHVEIPESHAKLFQLLETYLTRLMPDQKIKFLNILAADAENKLEMISEQLELMTDLYE